MGCFMIDPIKQFVIHHILWMRMVLMKDEYALPPIPQSA